MPEYLMEAKQFGTFHSEPLTVNIGAQITGIDLNRLEESDLQAIHDALIYYQVIFFRDQDLSSESHLKSIRLRLISWKVRLRTQPKLSSGIPI